MPLFLLANWKWLLGVAGMAVLGIMLGLARIEIANLERDAAKTALDIQTQKTNAQTLIAAAARNIANLAREKAEQAAQLDKEQTDGQKEIDDRDRHIAQLIAANGGLRIKASRCGSSGASGLPGGDAVTGLPPQPAGGAECGLSTEVSGAFRGDYRDAASVTNFARSCLAAAVACYAKPGP